MFSLNEFVMKTLNGMIGNYPEFQVREYALNWYAKGVLTEEDLAEIEMWFVPPTEEPTDDIPSDEEETE